jgi:hypothetical protein
MVMKRAKKVSGFRLVKNADTNDRKVVWPSMTSIRAIIIGEKRMCNARSASRNGGLELYFRNVNPSKETSKKPSAWNWDIVPAITASNKGLMKGRLERQVGDYNHTLHETIHKNKMTTAFHHIYIHWCTVLLASELTLDFHLEASIANNLAII